MFFNINSQIIIHKNLFEGPSGMGINIKSHLLWWLYSLLSVRNAIGITTLVLCHEVLSGVVSLIFLMPAFLAVFVFWFFQRYQFPVPLFPVSWQ